MESEPAPEAKRFSKKTVGMVVVLALLLTAAVVTASLVLAGGDSSKNGAGRETGQAEAETGGPGPSTGVVTEEEEAAQGSNPLSTTTNPPLPSGQPATHLGQARMTTLVSGQSFTVDVGLTVRLDGAGGFTFAYAGTGTVPVNLGPGVPATADYNVSGSFNGTVNSEAFTGSGPATIQATVSVPGMAPQAGGSTEQLTIKGTMRETEEGRFEGEFTGGSYSGTFWAEAV